VAAAPSASADWASVFSASDAADHDAPLTADAAPASIAADAALPLDPDGTLPFFLLDAHEDISVPGGVLQRNLSPVLKAPDF